MDEPGDRAALEASAAQFQQTVEASPFFGYGWFILGELRERLGEKDAAIAAYRRARELDPSDPFGAIVRLGRLGAEGPVSMPEGVNSELRRDQSYAEAQAALGRVYATMGLDPVADEATQLSVKELGLEIQKTMRDWRKVRADKLLAAVEPAAP